MKLNTVTYRLDYLLKRYEIIMNCIPIDNSIEIIDTYKNEVLGEYDVRCKEDMLFLKSIVDDVKDISIVVKGW